MSDATTPLLISNKYEVLSRLGRGGMGTVYKVQHTLLRTIWALKTLDGDIASNPDLVRRFEQEARSQAQLDHPNIVKVLDFDRDGDLYYFVMDFVDGPTLGQVLRERTRLDLADAVEIGAQLASALGHAHTRPEPVTHRDIKPGNVLLERAATPMLAKLTDFGIAKVGGGSELTQTGAMLASFRYGAPEQLGYRRRGERIAVDRRADIYALGIVLFEMIEGRRFFEDLEPPEVVARVVYDPSPIVPVFRDVSPPRALVDLIARMVSRDPEDRPESMEEVEAALRSAVAGDEPTLVLSSGDEAPWDPKNLRELLNETIVRQDAVIAARQTALAARAMELAATEYEEGGRLETRASELFQRGRYQDAQERFRQAALAYEAAARTATGALAARLDAARARAEGARDRLLGSGAIDDAPTLSGEAGTLLDEAARENDPWRATEIYERATTGYERALAEGESRRIVRTLGEARTAAIAARAAAEDAEAAVLARATFEAGTAALAAADAAERDGEASRAIVEVEEATAHFTRASEEAAVRREQRTQAEAAAAECRGRLDEAEQAGARDHAPDAFSSALALIESAERTMAAMDFATARERWQEAGRSFAEAARRATATVARAAVVDAGGRAVEARRRAEEAGAARWGAGRFAEATRIFEAADTSFEREDLTAARAGFVAAEEAFAAAADEAHDAKRRAVEAARTAADEAMAARTAAEGDGALAFAADELATGERSRTAAAESDDPEEAIRLYAESVGAFGRAAAAARSRREQVAAALGRARDACDAARTEADGASVRELASDAWERAEAERLLASEGEGGADPRPAIEHFEVAARLYREAIDAATAEATRREEEERQAAEAARREEERRETARRQQAEREAERREETRRQAAEREAAATEAAAAAATAQEEGATPFAERELAAAERLRTRAAAAEAHEDAIRAYAESVEAFGRAAAAARSRREQVAAALGRARDACDAARTEADGASARELASDAWERAEAEGLRASEGAAGADPRPAIERFEVAARLYREAGAAAVSEAARRETVRREEERQAAERAAREARRQEAERRESLRRSEERRAAEEEAARVRREAEAAADRTMITEPADDRTAITGAGDETEVAREADATVVADATRVTSGAAIDEAADVVVPPRPVPAEPAPGRALRIGASLAAVAATVVLAYFLLPSGEGPAPSEEPPPAHVAWDPAGVSPSSETVRISEGARQAFAVAVADLPAGGEVAYSWRVDGEARGTGPTFALEPGFEGLARTETVEASASGPWGSLTRKWSIEVADVPRPPTIEAAAPETEIVAAKQGDLVPFSIRYDDPDGADGGEPVVTWSVDGKEVAGASGGAFEARADSSATIAATVRDPTGLEATRTWRIEVAAVRTAPTFTLLSPRDAIVTASEGESVTLRATATNPEGEAVRLEWKRGPLSGGACAKGSCTFVAPTIDRPDQRYAVSVTARDPGGLEVVKEWTIRVRQAPPTLRRVRPRGRSVRLEPSEDLRLEVAGSSAAKRDLRYEWAVDGRTLPDRGARVALPTGMAVGRHRVTAGVVDDRGLRGDRVEWQVEVASVPATTIPAPEPPARVGLDAAVRDWVQRYELAFEAEDVAKLKALGVVKTASQERSIRDYFDKVEHLQVTVTQLAVTPEASGSAAGVRFTRKDQDDSGPFPAYTVTYRLVRRGSSIVAE